MQVLRLPISPSLLEAKEQFLRLKKSGKFPVCQRFDHRNRLHALGLFTEWWGVEDMGLTEAWTRSVV